MSKARDKQRFTGANIAALEEYFVESTVGRTMYRGTPSIVELDALDAPLPPVPEAQHNLHLEFHIRRPECSLCRDNVAIPHPEPPRPHYGWQDHAVKDPQPLPTETLAVAERAEAVIVEKKIQAVEREQKQDNSEGLKFNNHRYHQGEEVSALAVTPQHRRKRSYQGSRTSVYTGLTSYKYCGIECWFVTVTHGGNCVGRHIYPGSVEGEKSAAAFHDLVVRRLAVC